MRIVSVSHLVPGMRLARSVHPRFDGIRAPLLVGGTRIGPGIPEALRRAGIRAIYIEDGPGEGIEPTTVLPPEVREEAIGEVTRVFDRALTESETVVVDQREIERLHGVVDRVLGAIRGSGGLASSLAGLQGYDHYTLEHSVNVMTFGLAIGEVALAQRRESDARPAPGDGGRGDLIDLGLGLLLHDIGKMAVPTAILNKPGRLTDREMAIMREHPATGVRMVDGESLSSASRAVILSHHERHDGSGYPEGLVGDDIPPSARIAAIADVYDAISSDRPYCAGRPAHVAWEMVVEMVDRGFPRSTVQAFAQVVMPYPEGTGVRLNDGREAIVVRNVPGHGSRPVIRLVTDEEGEPIVPQEMDLADHADLAIAAPLDDLGAGVARE